MISQTFLDLLGSTYFKYNKPYVMNGMYCKGL